MQAPHHSFTVSKFNFKIPNRKNLILTLRNGDFLKTSQSIMSRKIETSSQRIKRAPFVIFHKTINESCGNECGACTHLLYYFTNFLESLYRVNSNQLTVFFQKETTFFKSLKVHNPCM